jgi:hypothetical protein
MFEKESLTLLHVHRKFPQINGMMLRFNQKKEIADFAGTTDEQVIRVIQVWKETLIKKTPVKKNRLTRRQIKKIGN